MQSRHKQKRAKFSSSNLPLSHINRSEELKFSVPSESASGINCSFLSEEIQSQNHLSNGKVLSSRNHGKPRVLSQVGSSIVTGYENIGGRNFGHGDGVRIRIRGKDSGYSMAKGSLDNTMGEQQKVIVRKKVLKRFKTL